jgi:PAS domain S-box-containing protein
MRFPLHPTRPPRLLGYAVAVGSTLLAFLLTLLLAPYLGQSIFSLFLAAVMVSAWYAGTGPGLLAAGLAALATFYVFLPPYFIFPLTLDAAVRVATFLAAALLISTLNAARRHSELEAHAERERYAVTLDSIGDAVIVTDRAGRITLMNPIAEALTGWPLADAEGRLITEVFHIINEGTRLTVEGPIERTLREGTIVGLANHTLLLARDGTERPIDDSGAPVRTRDGTIVGAVLVFRDISERRAEELSREAALRREQAARDVAEAAERRAAFLSQASALLATSLVAEERLQATARLAVSAVADLCVVFLKMPDGAIQQVAVAHADPSYEQVLQASLPASVDPQGPHPAAQVIRTGEMLTRPLSDDAALAGADAAPAEQAVAGTAAPRSHLVVPLTARGATLGALWLGRTGGSQPYTPAETRLVEELAQRTALAVDNARLYTEAQSAIQVRDRFLSLAAHELRTPLTAALGNLQLMRRRLARGEAGARVERNLQLAEEQLTRLNEMVTTLLDVARLEGGQLRLDRTAVDMCSLTRRIVEQSEAGLTDHTVSCKTPEAELIVHGDPMRLEQVLTNLLQNAVKYSPSGGGVSVQVGQRGDRVFLIVADQGMGIAADALPHLFERYYRAPAVTAQMVSGMGIGLYVVQEIVTLHGGVVQVESTEGKGSAFTVWLPLAQIPDPAAPVADAAAS